MYCVHGMFRSMLTLMFVCMVALQFTCVFTCVWTFVFQGGSGRPQGGSGSGGFRRAQASPKPRGVAKREITGDPKGPQRNPRRVHNFRESPNCRFLKTSIRHLWLELTHWLMWWCEGSRPKWKYNLRHPLQNLWSRRLFHFHYQRQACKTTRAGLNQNL